jgi:hypothetical protein
VKRQKPRYVGHAAGEIWEHPDGLLLLTLEGPRLVLRREEPGGMYEEQLCMVLATGRRYTAHYAPGYVAPWSFGKPWSKIV